MKKAIITASTLVGTLLMLAAMACGHAKTTDEAAKPSTASSTERNVNETQRDPDAHRPADGDTKGDSIELPLETQKRLGMAVAHVQEAALAETLQVVGTVQANESRVSHVRPLARGRVQAVHVKVGDHVTQGQPLAEFDNIEAGELSSQRESARAELARLQTQLAAATRQAERSRRLAAIGAVPQKEQEAALSEQHQLEASIEAQQSVLAGMGARLRRFGADDTSQGGPITALRAPIAGVVTQIGTAPGDVVDGTNELFAIADLSHVYVQAQVFERDLGQVRTGQTASIKVDAYPDQRFTGKVVAIADVIDAQTRTAAVRCDVANPNNLLKLEMFARVELPVGNSRPALTVPADAVQTYEGKTVVFVQVDTNRFEPRTVEVGRTAGSTTELVHGVTAADSVVTRGAFEVKSALLANELGDKDDDKDKKE